MPLSTAHPHPSPIAALPAEDSVRAQELMRRFAHHLVGSGVSVGGVTQARDDGAGRGRIVLRDVQSGTDYPISQDLGPGSVACNLDSSELALACARRRGFDRDQQIREAGSWPWGAVRRLSRRDERAHSGGDGGVALFPRRMARLRRTSGRRRRARS